MKDIKSWRLFGREASPSRPDRTSGEASVDASSAKGMDLEPGDFAEPTLVLDRDGGLVAASAEARALGGRLGVSLDERGGGERLLARVRLANGGGSPPWVPVAGTDGVDAIVSEPQPWSDDPVFELKSTRRHGADGRSAGWVVRLVDITPLIAAVRGRNEAIGHRDSLLKLLSHDMRSPLAAILATLAHPDLGEMPANLKQIIESAARRALHMVDSNVRLIRAQSSNYTFIELDFCHVMEEVVDACWSSSKAAGVKIVLQPPAAEQSILADRGSLTDALTDLIGKLLTGSVAGGRLVCSFEASTLQRQPAVTLTIKDANDGAIVRNRSRTVQGSAAFSQIETDAVDDEAGLDFFKTVIARHSGAIIRGSEPGIGRSISITIPIVDAGAARP